MWERAVRARPLLAVSVAIAASACSGPEILDEPSAEVPETLSRTEFTDRIENFFEYDALRAGETSQFLIHLTDLDDGAPVLEARVDLIVRSASGREVFRTRAPAGRAGGIYVAELAIPQPGGYAITFEVENSRLRETMVLDGFAVR